MLRVMSIYALTYALYYKTRLTSKQLPEFNENVRTPQEDCAGTVIGQELYKLVLVDMVLTPLSNVVLYVGLYLWHKERQELDMSQVFFLKKKERKNKRMKKVKEWGGGGG